MTFANLFSNKQEFIARRKALRLEPTMAEKVLWEELKNKKLGYKFRRQFNIGKYIVDFYCHELRLIIELDGPIHEQAQQKMYDKKREDWLIEQKYVILRYKNDEVLFEREKVMGKIRDKCFSLSTKKHQGKTNNPTLPSPTRGGE